jgi:hypothetical protein
MADGASHATIAELADRFHVLRCLARQPHTARQIALAGGASHDQVQAETARFAQVLRYMRAEGLVLGAPVGAGRGGGRTTRWSLPPQHATTRPRRSVRMLPLWRSALDGDDVLRHPCRHEDACLDELDRAEPRALGAACPKVCPHFERRAGREAPSGPSLLSLATLYALGEGDP